MTTDEEDVICDEIYLHHDFKFAPYAFVNFERCVTKKLQLQRLTTAFSNIAIQNAPPCKELKEKNHFVPILYRILTIATKDKKHHRLASQFLRRLQEFIPTGNNI